MQVEVLVTRMLRAKSSNKADKNHGARLFLQDYIAFKHRVDNWVKIVAKQEKYVCEIGAMKFHF